MNSPQCQLRFRFLLIGAMAFLVCCTFLVYLFASDSLRPSHLPSRPASVDLQGQAQPPYNTRAPSDQVFALPSPLVRLSPKNNATSRTLGVASLVFVLSLPRRIDRRMTMDALAHTLDLEFVYVDGVEATDASIDQIMRTVREARHTFRQSSSGNMVPNVQPSPEDGSLVDNPLSITSLDTASTPIPGVHEYEGTLGLSCATPEDPFPVPPTKLEFDSLPPWRILSRGMIACWIGHLNIIRQILKLQLEVAIVLEDDVDLEYDISSRLMDMWPALPHDGWDIVMLGHCHSNESMYPSLLGAPSLHPSFAPKCTHAYAISRSGAKRLARMLSTPGFAHSRALDQAISWLISTGKIRSYSVVPAIVVQSKRTASDIWRTRPGAKHHQEGQRGSDDSDKGSKWRGVLMASTLEKLVMKDTKVT
ncbi:hypothetical protein JB92DRAFT_2791854 [Gautieria morchelliformis]|nr:hypothetical protein JB92DRAFT_2791854 [Gautieria morchelliformis]